MRIFQEEATKKSGTSSTVLKTKQVLPVAASVRKIWYFLAPPVPNVWPFTIITAENCWARFAYAKVRIISNAVTVKKS